MPETGESYPPPAEVIDLQAEREVRRIAASPVPTLNTAQDFLTELEEGAGEPNPSTFFEDRWFRFLDALGTVKAVITLAGIRLR